MGKKHKHKKHNSKPYDDENEGEDREKEPLKMVLKLGGSEVPSDATQSPHDEKRHKRKKKKKKKSGDRDKERTRVDELKNEDEDMSVSQEEEEDTYEPPTKKRVADLDEESNSSQDVLPPRTTRLARESKGDEKGILREVLLYIQKKLQSKDINGFFAYPVNDVIAPGYSAIITEPMDFSTMLSKIENDHYDSILDYKEDYVQMCNNAMTYNRPETIYYKEAKRLLQSGIKMMSKEKLMSMKRSLGFMCSITLEELGVNKQDSTGAVIEAIHAKEKEYEKTMKNRDNIGRYEAFPDNMTSDEIIAQAKAAAKEAADMLTLREPRTQLSFLRRREDGSTSITVLNTDNDGIVGENEKVVSIGALTGKLASGTGNIAGFKEDKRNKVNQVNYLNYGPFSSHAPLYDSSFSNVSKDESDLLLSTYGDESGVQYAKSVMKFVEDAEEDCTRIVDSLLDALTKGQHTLAMKQIEQKRKEDQEQLAEINRRIAEEERETRQAEELVTQDSGEVEDEVQKRLDNTAGLLRDLQQSQYERLSQKLPLHLGHIQGPMDKEAQIAEKVTTELTHLAKDALPKNVASLQGIRNAMGISLESVEGTDESQPIEIVDQNDNQSEGFVENVDKTDQSDAMFQNDTQNAHSFIDNEMLMQTNDTVIDNL